MCFEIALLDLLSRRMKFCVSQTKTIPLNLRYPQHGIVLLSTAMSTLNNCNVTSYYWRL